MVEYFWGKRHSDILDTFLKELGNAEVEYFILRNYGGLPERNDSKDVDIIVRPRKYALAERILLKIFKQFAVPNYYTVKYERVRCWFGIDLDTKFAIHIDLIEGYLNKGFEIIPFDLFYKNTVEYNGYRVLNEAYDIVMLLLYKVIGCKELKNKYVLKIEEGYKNSAEHIDMILRSVLDEKESRIVINALKDKNYAQILEHSKKISKVSKKIALKRRPFKTSCNVLQFWMEKLYRIGVCPNRYRKFIAVEAPDGTGKTTFINELCVLLAQMFVCDIEKMHIYHFRPGLFPNLGAVGERMGVMEQDKDFTCPHRNKPANPVSSFIRISYYWLDYIVGTVICVRKDVQFDKFTIFDRYAYDFIVDPLRSRINLPETVRSVFTRLVPQPHMVFILEADAKVIYKRKQELSLEEINRQLKEFERLSRRGKQFIKLNACRSIEEMVDEAAEKIISRYTYKT
ncbi:hypothetical protein [uncultured Clostridium sp.]|uniref:hypothetical protein n=1 Tax=uncultured Clostridium sp. TaxID=59620 RepID=UPI0025F4E381|nr:hypothetical protein [uncultured Clostridium sp.]